FNRMWPMFWIPDYQINNIRQYHGYNMMNDHRFRLDCSSAFFVQLNTPLPISAPNSEIEPANSSSRPCWETATNMLSVDVPVANVLFFSSNTFASRRPFVFASVAERPTILWIKASSVNFPLTNIHELIVPGFSRYICAFPKVASTAFPTPAVTTINKEKPFPSHSSTAT